MVHHRSFSNPFQYISNIFSSLSNTYFEFCNDRLNSQPTSIVNTIRMMLVATKVLVLHGQTAVFLLLAVYLTYLKRT